MYPSNWYISMGVPKIIQRLTQRRGRHLFPLVEMDTSSDSFCFSGFKNLTIGCILIGADAYSNSANDVNSIRPFQIAVGSSSVDG